MKAYLDIAGAPARVGPYAPAVRSTSGLLFCAGQIALDPATGKIVEGGVEAQAVRVCENLKLVLEGAGSGWDKVLMTTIFLTDIADTPVVNEIYGRYVSQDAPPARQTVAVKALPREVSIEISVIAE